ncbi:MAG TPA: outer membrane beta-barrel protein [Flavisolibacter sp.]|nr:outer membrane beta-barrel protein [Flavisolibacter sp.]
MKDLNLSWTKAWNWRSRAFLFCSFLACSLSSFAQREIHREEQDNKPYYFGLSLSAVYSRFQIEHHPSFLQQDSILVAEPQNTPGISLRLVAGLNLTNRFELRFNPGLIFSERPILYTLNRNYPPDIDQGYNVKKSVESIITTFPLSLKFKSDRIGNFRVYMLGGGKLDLDLASNAQKRKADDVVRLKKLTYGIEAGMGFNFYRKSVTVTPEIKISNGLNNLHDRNPNLPYSRVVDRIQSRMIIFTLHLEG